MQAQKGSAHWSSRFAFLMAAVGAAVGLGNFWRFPYMAGENGGGAFIVIYIVCVLGVALPILMAELLIGRRGGLSAVGSLRKVAVENGSSPMWRVIGWVSMIAAFLILSYYSVIAGWLIAYIPQAMTGALKGITAEASAERFKALLGMPRLLAFYHAVFMVLTVFIVSRGVIKGIERAVEILMPLFFFLLLGIVAYSWVTGDTTRAFDFMFSPDFSQITPSVILDAIGQAFFSIGVGMAIMMTYGAYLTQDMHIPRASSIICVADTMVAVLAGIAIFPIVFAVGLDPAGGPGLLFATLPVAFGQMPFGQVFGTAFFSLALFAALTSSISLLEIAVSWGEEHTSWGRARLAYVAGFLAWVIGIASVLSSNIWSDVYVLGMFAPFQTMTIFDLIDYMTANIMLPLAGILTAIFAGWVLQKTVTLEELRLSDGAIYAIWRGLMRYVVPVSVGAVLVYLTIGKALLG